MENKQRFAFGKNWQKYIDKKLCDADIETAEESLKRMLNSKHLKNVSFLDVGSGSGLFSLAAINLGATVRSFDYDRHSVACTKKLKADHYPRNKNWKIEQGSILDDSYISKLGEYDVVYSWGVLHHTGDLKMAMNNAGMLVKDGGLLFISLYNDQGIFSRYWHLVKRLYNKYKIIRPLLILVHSIYPTIPCILYRKIRGIKDSRGMNPWIDLIDWLGGYPFEVSTPEDVVVFYLDRGYRLIKIKTVGGKMGCNQYIFKRRIK